MTTAPTQSLEDFAAERGGFARPRCVLCNVPLEVERQVLRGKDAKLQYRIICDWLNSLDLGYGHITKARLERHLYEAHKHPDLDTEGDTEKATTR